MWPTGEDERSPGALQTFQLLGLAGGETIHLVSVQREGWEAEAFARLASDFLDAHGAAYKLHKLESGEEPAHVLLEQVRVLRPRLLVMGAHGYHPLRDLFRYICDAVPCCKTAPFPCLLAHEA